MEDARKRLKGGARLLKTVVATSFEKMDPFGLANAGKSELYDPVIAGVTRRLKRLKVKPTVEELTVIVYEAFTDNESSLRKTIGYVETAIDYVEAARTIASALDSAGDMLDL